MSSPRARRRRSADAPTSSSPCERTLPDTVAPPGRRPEQASPIVDLPQPDSPTRPRLSPGASTRSTPSTATERPARGGVRRPAGRHLEDRLDRVRRAGRSRLVAAGPGRAATPADRLGRGPAVRRPTRPVRPHDRSSGLTMSFSPSPSSVSPVTSSMIARPGKSAVHQKFDTASLTPAADVEAPLGLRVRDAVAEEPEAGEGQHRVGGVEGEDHRHALHDVEEHVAADHRGRGLAPSERAASTNGSCFTDRVWLRITR